MGLPKTVKGLCRGPNEREAHHDVVSFNGDGFLSMYGPWRWEPRVLVADDDPLARMAIEAMIKRGERLELVGSAADVPQIVELAAATRPDVAVVDFIMPGAGGPETARQIQERSPGTRIVGLTAADGPDAYLAMLRAGASGLLVKGGSAERLVEMIHRAHESTG